MTNQAEYLADAPTLCDPETPASVSADALPAGTQAASKIMLVDDEPVNIRVTRKYLQRAGYANIVATTDPTQAVELVGLERPDLLLLDILMPGVDGLEILRRIRENPRLMRLPVIVLTASSDPEVKHQALMLGATDFLNKPADATELVTRVRNSLTVKAFQDHLAGYAQELERQIRKRTEDLATSRIEVIQCLSRAAECRSDLNQRHGSRVGAYSGAIARGIGLGEKIAESIELAASLHDVGKIGFPDALLTRTERFAREEFDLLQKRGVTPPAACSHVLLEDLAVYKSHTVAGSRIMAIGHSGLLELAAVIAMNHHEKWDGTGYPFGTSGKNIPLEARIVSIANLFDILGSRQGHRPAFPDDECFAILADGAGTHFDPDLVAAFLSMRPELLRLKATLTGNRTVEPAQENCDIPAKD